MTNKERLYAEKKAELAKAFDVYMNAENKAEEMRELRKRVREMFSENTVTATTFDIVRELNDNALKQVLKTGAAFDALGNEAARAYQEAYPEARDGDD